jgi:hypothetical protein
MTQHLSPDEFVAAVEGALAAGREAHVSTCGVCNGQIAELRVILEELRGLPEEVPEPPSFFWAQLTERVRAATVARRDRERSFGAFGWPAAWRAWLAAGLAMAALVFVIGWYGAISAGLHPAVPAGARTDEAAWESVADLASGLSADDVRGIVAAPADAPLVSALTPAERAQFVQLVKQEIGQ